ncbi:hypothetical protein Cgig2_007269 [Carnegiea gigantea]|uniref:Gnk2-homologous domain-containing protein n=1 Tax=Carnegiea gigantea TaxID=171969 RepID=A0A9Q1QSA7_9CARY|nr:hypothetical protein Cgig2_007269 [Carnegiea gigantea]
MAPSFKVYYRKNTSIIEPDSLASINIDNLLRGMRSSSNAVFMDEDNHIYGLGQCRGDLDMNTCSACIGDASLNIKASCPDVSDAQIWYDECTSGIAGTCSLANLMPQIIMRHGGLPSPASSLRSGLAKLLDKIKARIATDPTLGGFANAELQLTRSNTLYGVAQCTQDFSSDVCGKCFEGTKAEFEDNKPCSGKVGCKVFYGSCDFRYAFKPFLCPYANKFEKISDKALEELTRYKAKQIDELSSRKSMMVSSF